MKYTFDHPIDATMFLWLDNLLLEVGSGFYNYSGSFRSVESTRVGYNTFAAPHRQFVYDNSIPSSYVPSGAYINGSFVSTGSALYIDTYHGQVFYSGSASTVTSRYNFKEVNLYFTTSSEQSVLFENKFSSNPKYAPANDTYKATDIVYPCIFLRTSAGTNKTLTLDTRMAATTIPVRLVFLADSYYLYRAVTSLVRDRKETCLALFSAGNTPFNSFYALKNANFDYSAAISSIQEDPNKLAFIRDVSVSDFDDKINREIGPEVVGGFIDIDLEIPRFPHLS